jgi:hypothetical protein
MEKVICHVPTQNTHDKAIFAVFLLNLHTAKVSRQNYAALALSRE